MKFIVLHLSDTHFTQGDKQLLGRINRIGDALYDELRQASYCFIVITGDIAFSGLINEYNVATLFVSNLETSLKSVNATLNVEKICVPGNHDCDFLEHHAEREQLIRITLSDLGASVTDTTASECMKVQKHYFNWVSSIQSCELTETQKLFYRREYSISNKIIRFKLPYLNPRP